MFKFFTLVSAFFLSLAFGAFAQSTFTGAVSNDWNTAANWSPNGVPATNANVIFTGTSVRQVIVTSNQNCQNISLVAGATVTLNAGVILRVESGASPNSISGTGSIVGDGVVRLSPLVSSASTLSGTMTIDNLELQNLNGISVTSGSTISITNELAFNNATPFTNDGSVVFVSTAAKTARMGIVAGTISGTGSFTVQRYVGGVPRWVFMGAPVQGAGVTVGQLSELNAVVQPPNNASLFFFDETDSAKQTANGSTYARFGWRTLGSSSDLLNPGAAPRGYRAYVRSNFLGGVNPVVSVTGQLYTGNLVVPVTKTPAAYFGGGYNLLTNPYASPINWNGLTRGGGVGNAYYVYDGGAGAYGVYVGPTGVDPDPEGVSLNITGPNASNIAAGQSFFVRTSANSTLTFGEAAKTTNLDRTFLRTGPLVDRLRIKISNAANKVEETLIRFRNGATDGFDDASDAGSFGGDFVSVSTVMPGAVQSFDVNTLPTLTGRRSLYLSIYAATTGTHSLRFSEMESFEDYVSLVVVDHFTGTRFNPRTAPNYTFSVTSNPASMGSTRFEVIFTDTRVSSVKEGILTSNLSVWPNPATGSDKVLVGVSGTLVGEANLFVLDAAGRQVHTQAVTLSGDANQAFELTTALPSGTYTVRCITDKASMATKLVVNN